jgi:hypothetical protein
VSESASIFESLYNEELYAFASPVVVVVSQPWSEISAEHKSVLAKMLVAVKLSLEKVQIVTRQEFSLEELAPFQSGKVLAFGTNLKSPVALYQNISQNGTSLIIADSLDQLDDTRKKNLWLALRQMFGV